MSKPVASNDRLLALRLRPDLVAVPVEMAGASTWVVRDPLTLEHFHFSPEEHALLEMLRHPVSLAEMSREFAREFPPRTIAETELWAFLSRLHEAGLLMSDAPGQGDELLQRHRQERFRSWSLAWAQLTAIRFRGINPDAALTAIHRHASWLFSRTALALATAIVLFAGSIVVGHFDEVRRGCRSFPYSPTGGTWSGCSLRSASSNACTSWDTHWRVNTSVAKCRRWAYSFWSSCPASIPT